MAGLIFRNVLIMIYLNNWHNMGFTNSNNGKARKVKMVGAADKISKT